jgi:hypothetical protein
MRVREKEAFDGQISAAEMRNVEKFFPDKSMMTLIIIDSFTTTRRHDEAAMAFAASRDPIYIQSVRLSARLTAVC